MDSNVGTVPSRRRAMDDVHVFPSYSDHSLVICNGTTAKQQRNNNGTTTEQTLVQWHKQPDFNLLVPHRLQGNTLKHTYAFCSSCTSLYSASWWWSCSHSPHIHWRQRTDTSWSWSGTRTSSRLRHMFQCPLVGDKLCLWVSPLKVTSLEQCVLEFGICVYYLYNVGKPFIS